ncbi:hypothetical protein VKT23_015255 [Stygiomarasmius scandens]|uniref:Uncharacterized protein n=1 Tax=Marasmiellus scandens TaxID=2682957 RepID=A0ABR1IYE7_9AGAR
MTKKLREADKKATGHSPWYHDAENARLSWLQTQMAECDKCDEAGQMSAFLTTTATQFMGKFGFQDDEKDINIPAKVGFEDVTPGAVITTGGSGPNDMPAEPNSQTQPQPTTSSTQSSQPPPDQPVIPQAPKDVIKPIKGIEYDKLCSAAEQLGWLDLSQNELLTRTTGFKLLHKASSVYSFIHTPVYLSIFIHPV